MRETWDSAEKRIDDLYPLDSAKHNGDDIVWKDLTWTQRLALVAFLGLVFVTVVTVVVDVVGS